MVEVVGRYPLCAPGHGGMDHWIVPFHGSIHVDYRPASSYEQTSSRRVRMQGRGRVQTHSGVSDS